MGVLSLLRILAPAAVRALSGSAGSSLSQSSGEQAGGAVRIGSLVPRSGRDRAHALLGVG
ncbi:hypothetical protein [Nonomuraea sp. SYSU D8015]|uniref:hypothetical protein n=1 Tax=Nonomuraea sp. SYSU D8015 TaxID=2593644 RepID=UPI0016609138|nr:hypothetical protein [Nonomuraea sp. SYSU D8015]